MEELKGITTLSPSIRPVVPDPRSKDLGNKINFSFNFWSHQSDPAVFYETTWRSFAYPSSFFAL